MCLASVTSERAPGVQAGGWLELSGVAPSAQRVADRGSGMFWPFPDSASL